MKMAFGDAKHYSTIKKNRTHLIKVLKKIADSVPMMQVAELLASDSATFH